MRIPTQFSLPLTAAVVALGLVVQASDCGQSADAPVAFQSAGKIVQAPLSAL
ncbi:hypothetical protein [Pseudoprimorskyibacter insulae]|uniref:Uncharacterized protein n=1 Tax=Pseudoprimorskyibacter insulae TaxID=1695997 RepID=A0A2R8APE7_9RHOB|nr:hypothetical protein [Pseudoprimorskyibacter insulae]SPF77885.1 hypothetical protein PRI8871_00472 [Pseudoprimorskyibacter insulae]